jgi:site-specific recombinase XerD
LKYLSSLSSENEEGKKMNFSNEAILNQLKGWTPPVLHQKTECYISFSAFCPDTGRMKTKKIMLGRIKGKRNQRLYAEGIMQNLTEKLMGGWNPFIETTTNAGYEKFDHVCDRYHDYVLKLMKDSGMREESAVSYLSYLKIMREWITNNKKVFYVYQFDKKIVSDFLDYVYIDRNNTLRTRNNYLAWVKVFCHYLINKDYLQIDPSASFSLVAKNSQIKNRAVIPDAIMIRIYEYLINKNPHFLLACYMLHYVFIRPREMTYIQIRDVSIKNQTIFVHGQNAKNHNDAVLTLPEQVLKLMIRLDIFSKPDSYYLFSDDFCPGQTQKSEKKFRDFWIRYVRKNLDLPSKYKFYSLKDTGITNMLRANTDILSVRDQARHSSIFITDMYTPKDIKKANQELLRYKGVF